MTILTPAADHAALVVLAVLLLGTVAGGALRLAGRAIAADWNARMLGWWLMVGLVLGALALGPTAFTVLFALISFHALREFITLSPTRRADHHALFWAFFVVLPIQFWLAWKPWYGLFTVFVPVWAFLFMAARSALAGDPKGYLERTAKIQWGLMSCVFALSHIPALTTLPLRAELGGTARGPELVLWLLLVVQLSDVFQYIWGKSLGRHPLAPVLSPKKTWEGLLLGVLSAAGAGAALCWLTPFPPWQAALVALALCLAGFCGGLVMSAIKRDAGIKDWSHLIPGHGGILDRVDSLVFAAPAFFHILRFCCGG